MLAHVCDKHTILCWQGALAMSATVGVTMRIDNMFGYFIVAQNHIVRHSIESISIESGKAIRPVGEGVGGREGW